jgi:hypothetical protein
VFVCCFPIGSIVAIKHVYHRYETQDEYDSSDVQQILRQSARKKQNSLTAKPQTPNYLHARMSRCLMPSQARPRQAAKKVGCESE